jgi:hypothetical protein
MVKETELHQFISRWNFSKMPFIIIETLKEIKIIKNPNFSDIAPKLIERIRIFGNGGDFDLKRETFCFRWRYIGQDNPPLDINGDNFWGKNPDKQFFQEEKEALLWGKYNQNKKSWHDNRVARAKLSYPINGNPERVKICYKTLSEGGCISFVWFMELKGVTENE